MEKEKLVWKNDGTMELIMEWSVGSRQGIGILIIERFCMSG